jgi:amino acid permease
MVIMGNVSIAFLVYALLGIFGYLAFLDQTEGNILENYSYNNTSIQLGTAHLMLTRLHAVSADMLRIMQPHWQSRYLSYFTYH